MPIEQLTYAQIAERLSVSTEAARAIVRRHRLPRSRSNDGKTLAAIDLEEIRHKPLPVRSPRGHRSVTDVIAALKARIQSLEAELAAEDRLIAELENLRSLLEAAQQPARSVTSRTWLEMSWPERWRWLRTTG